MKSLSFICIFFIILFLYLHIVFYLKTSNDIDIYELDEFNADKLNDMCNLRQPIVSSIPQHYQQHIDLNTYSEHDVLVSKESQTYVPLKLKLKALDSLLKSDPKYYSKNNHEFLENTGLINQIKIYNELFSPFKEKRMYHIDYDMIIGAYLCTTNLSYEVSYRNYLYVSEGNISLKLVLPECTDLLHKVNNYNELKFVSPFNLWNIQKEYTYNYNKLKIINVTLQKGDFIFIPNYWWYTIQFNEKSTLLLYKYMTFMNFVSIFPHYVLHKLQQQNTKIKIYKNITPHTNNEPSSANNENNADDKNKKLTKKLSKKNE
jgi:hypothetical protein